MSEQTNPAPGALDASAAPVHEPPPSPPPPRGPRGRVILAIAALLAAGMVAGVFFAEPLQSVVARIAGMFGDDHDHDDAESAFYTCGMHPWVLLSEPGTCPVCHMKLEPVDPASFTGELTINPIVVQNMGVRTEAVITGPLTASIRTVGTVEYAEPLVRDINTKVSGWIEKLHVDSVGARVKPGDVLFDVYSPELYAAQEEFLLAARQLRDNPGEGTRALLESARTRLLYFDVSEAQIDELQRAGKPTKALGIRSPYGGVVVEKDVLEGQKIEAGTRVYRVADLSRVWVMGTIYEYQLPYIREGQQAMMSLPYIPGQTFEGKVLYVYPFLSETRQARVRLAFDNPAGLLKPGMFANISLTSTLAEDRVLAPRSAIIDTGKRQVAFVSLGEGRFEPRQVQMGLSTEAGMVEIRDGLKPGERVVTSGQFLIDSEASIRESRARMVRGEPAAGQLTTVESAGEAPAEQLPAEARRHLAEMLRHYVAIGDALAADHTDGIAEGSRALAAAADAMMAVEIPGDAHFWHRHEEVATVRGEALELIAAADIKAARLDYADLSVALARFVGSVGVPEAFGAEVHQLHCPMYLEGQGGSTWLQRPGDVRNPYYGAIMLKCFDKRFALPMSP